MRLFFSLLLFVLIFPLESQAQSLAQKIQNQYESIQSFRTDFVQELTNASSREVETRDGVIYFKQPRLIRWETNQPDPELLIVGPEVVWDYFPREDVAYRYETGQIFNSKTMLRFISGKANLEEDFTLEEQGKEQGWQKIKLIPRKPEPNLVLAYIWVDPEQVLLRQILLIDFFGNGNQLTFEEIELNTELAEDLFTFEPPQNVEVLEN